MLSSVILNESIRKLGKAGDIVQVKPGYARYLISTKRVLRATKENLKILEEQRILMEEENKNKLIKAEELKLSLADKVLVIIRQSSDDSKIFGSVTSKDISKLLSDLNYTIHHNKIFFNGTIKTLGEYSISIELHADLVISIPLYVVKSESAAEEVKRAYQNKSLNKQTNIESVNNADSISN